MKGDILVMQNDNDSKFKVWDPLNIFRCPAECKHAVVVLNRPIVLGYDIVLPLWKKGNVYQHPAQSNSNIFIHIR